MVEAPRPRVAVHRVVERPETFALWMAGAAVIAAVAGIVLGVLAAAEAGVGVSRWSETVQAHGRLQLSAFAAPFICALAMEFMPRLNQQPMLPLRERVGIPALLAVGALAMGLGQVFELPWNWWVVPATGVVLGGATWFAVVAVRFRSPRPPSIDPQPLYFRAAGVWLAVAALIAVWGVLDAEARVVPLDLSGATHEVFLRGFVTLTIGAVAIRAFPGHLGTEPMSLQTQRLCLAGISASVALWLAGAGLGNMDGIGWLTRVADVGFAASLLAFTVGIGVFNGWRSRLDGPRYGVLIPVAWLGVVVYAVLLAVVAILPGGRDLTLYQDGAIRHTYMLGFMVPLMVAMAHVVLARFGVGRIRQENLLTASFVALVVSWPLRVIPAIVSDAPSEFGQVLLSTAGGLAMVGFALLAWVSAGVARDMRAARR